MNFEFAHTAQIVPDIAETVAWCQRLLPNMGQL